MLPFNYLKDPKKDRTCNEVSLPVQGELSSDQFWKSASQTDWRTIFYFLMEQGKIKKQDMVKLLKLVIQVLKRESNLLYLEDPITLVGDIHGQFYDLQTILKLGGPPESNNYLFLGDYVDRGVFSIEVCIVLFALKLNFPNNVYLLRGNHETRECTTHYSFHQECIHKFDQEVFELMMETFDSLPVAAVLNKRLFIVHGGISPNINKVEEINSINRYIETPLQGPLNDMSWSDPVKNTNTPMSNNFQTNHDRGCSVVYGPQAVKKFLEQNNLLTIIRAHEVEMEGYKHYNWTNTNFPCVITLFSAPNYTGSYNNCGAVIKMNRGNMEFNKYKSRPCPFYLPPPNTYQNLFKFSLPFISEKILEMVISIYHHIQQQDEQYISNSQYERIFAQIQNDPSINNKIKRLETQKNEYTNQRVTEMQDILAFQQRQQMIQEQPKSFSIFQSFKQNDKRNESLRPSLSQKYEGYFKYYR